MRAAAYHDPAWASPLRQDALARNVQSEYLDYGHRPRNHPLSDPCLIATAY